ncbi:MAG: T9SS type A sorting domain-containing protein [bacterium]
MRKVIILMVVMLLAVSATYATEWPGITPIKTVQFVADPVTEDRSTLMGDTVTVEGWVTFEPLSMNPDGRGFWMADSAGAWHGVYIYKSAAGFDFAFGTKVSVRGKVTEYKSGSDTNGNYITEISPMTPATDVTVLSDVVDWTDLPAACAYTVVPAADLTPFYNRTGAEQWEGVLVQVNDVVCDNADAGYGEWSVTDGDSTVLIDNPQNTTYGYFHKRLLDQPFDYVRGVVNVSYGYHILPEISHDLKVAVDPDNGWYTQFSWFQQVRPYDMKIQTDGSGNTYMLDQSYSSNARYAFFDGTVTGRQDTVTVRGVVTSSTGLNYAGAGVKFIMSDAVYALDTDPVEQPWSSVLSYDPDSTAFPYLFDGDEVIVTGYISEYITGEGNMTELFITEPIEVPTFDHPLPAPVQVTVADVRDGRKIEKWGTAFVYLKGVQVVNNTPGLDNMKFVVDDPTPDATPGFGIDDDSDFTGSPEASNWDTFGQPPVNTIIDSVVGWVYDHFGSLGDVDGSHWTYKVAPKFPLIDIVLGEAPPLFVSGGRNIAAPTPSDAVGIAYNIIDDVQVDSAFVWYRVGETGDFTGVKMTNVEGDSFVAIIPAQSEGADVWYFSEAFNTFEDLSVVTTLEPSDTSKFLNGYHVSASPLTIAQLQWTPYAGGSSRYEGYSVTVTGVVIDSNDIAFQYGYTEGCAYYLQAGTDPSWNSILVHINSTDMAVGSAVEAGDAITVTGVVNEITGGSKFVNNTRLKSVGTNFTVNSSGNALTFHEVSVTDLTGTPEPYESQAVKILNPTFVQKNSYDWTFEDAGGNRFLVDDDMINYAANNSTIKAWFSGLAGGTSNTSPAWIQGIWLYSYGTWKLEPRLWYDVESLLGPQASVAEAGLPKVFALYPVYPNPFNPSTTVAFQLPKNAAVKVIVYNMLGQKVRTLIDQPMVAGQHTVMWHGVNDSNMPVASGVYFLRFDAADFHKMQKMVLIK